MTNLFLDAKSAVGMDTISTPNMVMLNYVLPARATKGVGTQSITNNECYHL